jgi:isocitrate dehydrogenase
MENNMQVSNMYSNNGNKVANQFIITDGVTDYFQSYNSMIVKRIDDQVYLDEHYWNYSVTTSKYRNMFLNETTKETQKKIKDGVYILTNLN